MKKTRLLNSEISAAIAAMGHTDKIAVVDCGFPVPAGAKRIDLCLEKGIPSLLQTIDVLLSELQVQSVVLATETREHNAPIHTEILEQLGDAHVSYVSHEEFKRMTSLNVPVVIRTGEASKYANVILEAGVTF